MKSCRRAVGEVITEWGGVFPDAVTPTAEEERLSPQVPGATYLDAVMGPQAAVGLAGIQSHHNSKLFFSCPFWGLVTRVL